MSGAGRVVRLSAAVVVLVGVTGWLEYLRRVPVGGPRVADALPLYEAAGHDSVPAVWVWAAWLSAALVITTLLRVRSVLAAVSTAIVVFVAVLVLQAVELYLVRESTYGYDWSAAVRTTPPWLAGGACLWAVVIKWLATQRDSQDPAFR